jgi:hypothetical protein
MITATAKVTIPGGTEYCALGNKDTKQKLVIATPVTDIKTVTADVTWFNKVDLLVSKTCASITVYNNDLKISSIEVKGFILAPNATLDFPWGLISGQVIVKNSNGSGQFNSIKFIGKINVGVTITNIAHLEKIDQPTLSIVLFAIAQSNGNYR